MEELLQALSTPVERPPHDLDQISFPRLLLEHGGTGLYAVRRVVRSDDQANVAGPGQPLSLLDLQQTLIKVATSLQIDLGSVSRGCQLPCPTPASPSGRR